MRARAFLALLMTLAIAAAAPLVGLALSGLPTAPYLDFPPRTAYASHAPFSWPVFIATSLPVVAALALYAAAIMRARRRRIGGPPDSPPDAAGRRFPPWGWIGLALVVGGWSAAWSTAVPAEWRRYTFTPLWLGYVVTMNALAYRRSGRSPLTHRTALLLALFPASAAFWWLFEYLNQFTASWHYGGLQPGSDWDYFVQATLPFSTVLPAVASTRAWLRTFATLDALPLPAVAGRRAHAWISLVGGTLALAGIGLFPEILYAMLWLGPIFVLAGLQFLLTGETLFAPLARGDWRPVLQPALAALVCGFFWELWNYGSLAQWHYSIPYVDRFHVFEMPLLGYAGYLPFGLECALAVDLVAKMLGKK